MHEKIYAKTFIANVALAPYFLAICEVSCNFLMTFDAKSSINLP
jgi:hypothetical protein